MTFQDAQATRDAIITTMWAQGHSLRGIGAKIGRGRNAVADSAKRLGLPARDKAAYVHPFRKPKATDYPPIGPIGTFPDTGCKYIVGDVTPQFQCCGHPQHKGSWCEFHAGRVFTQARIA